MMIYIVHSLLYHNLTKIWDREPGLQERQMSFSHSVCMNTCSASWQARQSRLYTTDAETDDPEQRGEIKNCPPYLYFLGKCPGGKSVLSEARKLMCVSCLKVRPNGSALSDHLYLIANICLTEYSSLSVYDFKKICGSYTAFKTAERSSRK